MVFYPGREFKEPDGTVRTETRYTHSEYVYTLLISQAAYSYLHSYGPTRVPLLGIRKSKPCPEMVTGPRVECYRFTLGRTL